MFEANLKIAVRSLLKRRGFTIINSLGLSLGLTSCLLIVLFVKHEYSYDEFFQDSDQIFLMAEERISPEGVEVSGNVPYSFVRTVLNDYPEVESATAVAGPFSNQNVAIKNDFGEAKTFLESNVLLADSNFFKV